MPLASVLGFGTSPSLIKEQLYCLHEHTVLPLAARTQFEVGRIPLRGMEGGIAQDDHASVDLPNQPLKGIIGDIGRCTVPPYHQAILV